MRKYFHSSHKVEEHSLNMAQKKSKKMTLQHRVTCCKILFCNDCQSDTMNISAKLYVKTFNGSHETEKHTNNQANRQTAKKSG